MRDRKGFEEQRKDLKNRLDQLNERLSGWVLEKALVNSLIHAVFCAHNVPDQAKCVDNMFHHPIFRKTHSEVLFRDPLNLAIYLDLQHCAI